MTSKKEILLLLQSIIYEFKIKKKECLGGKEFASRYLAKLDRKIEKHQSADDRKPPMS